MTTLLEQSAKIIDTGAGSPPNWRTTDASLEEVEDGVAMCLSFGHSIAVRTDDGLVVFDTSTASSAPGILAALRSWSAEPVRTVVYTHGHLDHVGGSAAFAADCAGRGEERPTFIGHANVAPRMARYKRLAGWQARINARQFQGRPPDDTWVAASGLGTALPPDVTYTEQMELSVGGVEILLTHARGETDDHTWAWLPERRIVLCGDLFTWVFPNAGNPQKAQRYPGEWAAALRSIAARRPALLLPAHGLPIGGEARIAAVLDETATALETLEAAVVAMMNGGATLDEILGSVRVPQRALDLPYLRPVYDEPEFLIHNVWRLYGGWWDGNPARLKPPRDSALASEVAALAGGTSVLADRALAASAAGDDRLACQLVEWATEAAPADAALREARALIYRTRSERETSLMARGIFAEAALRSADHAPPVP